MPDGTLFFFKGGVRGKLREVRGKLREVNKNEELIIGIAANKYDLYEYQVVNREEGEKFAKDNNCLFYITSAKDHVSVKNAFEGLTRAYIEQIERKKKIF